MYVEAQLQPGSETVLYVSFVHLTFLLHPTILGGKNIHWTIILDLIEEWHLVKTTVCMQVHEHAGECTTPDGEMGSCYTLASCVQAEFKDDYGTFLKYFCAIGR
jgi:hypothetical protein